MAGTSRSGRRPKPTALKIAEGNPGKRKLNALEPKLAPGEPPMPKLDKAEADVWHATVPVLLDMGVLTAADGAKLADYCADCVIEQRIRKSIKRGGIFVHGQYGQLSESAAMRALDRVLKRKHQFYTEFGLTPAARSKIKIEAKPEVDAFETFLGKAAATKAAPAFDRNLN